MTLSDTPCATCGQPAQDEHHIEPRGRAPEKRDDPENLAPLCRRCHDMMIPEGPWSIEKLEPYIVCEGCKTEAFGNSVSGTRHCAKGKLVGRHRFWRTYVVDPVLDIQHCEEVSRRPISGGQSQALTLLHEASDKVDYRDQDGRVTRLLSLATDAELELFDEFAMRMEQVAGWLRVLEWHEWYLRSPGKRTSCDCEKPRPQWAHDIAKRFGLAEITVVEDVNAAKLYHSDDGPRMEISWYTVPSHADDPEEAFKISREMYEAGKYTITDLRAKLRGATERQEKCTCPECGDRHTAKKEAVG